MPSSRKHALARQHEEDLAEFMNGRRHRGSGNQFNSQMDGHHAPTEDFAFRWDGKCAMPDTKSISISREMIEKAIEQAHGYRPMLALRYYDDERGRQYDDWVAVRIDDFIELRESALEDYGYDEWLARGMERGWVEGACGTHDLPPMTSDEQKQFEEGYDPCIPVLRAWGRDGKPDG